MQGQLHDAEYSLAVNADQLREGKERVAEVWTAGHWASARAGNAEHSIIPNHGRGLLSTLDDCTSFLRIALTPFPPPPLTASLQAEARALQREQAVAVLQRHADSATADLRGCLVKLRAEREQLAVGQEEAAKLRDGVEELRMELKGASRKVCGHVGVYWGGWASGRGGDAARV